jgi:hypothetical protein
VEEMKFKLAKQIHSCFSSFSTNDVFLYLDIELPFYPYKGLIIVSDDIEEEIIEVYYDVKEQVFLLYAKADKRFKNVHEPLKNHHETKEFKDLIEGYIEMGWKK